jgi:flagellar protein FliS
MNKHDSVLAYRQSTAFGASPVGQVVALYDTILRDLHRAMAAIAAGEVEERVAASNHALLVIGELQGVLNFELGGESARNLDNFYNVARKMIVQASIKCSRETFQEAISMVTRIRSAWARIERSVPATGSTERLRISRSQPQAGVPKNDPVLQENPDAPGHGGWSA